MVEEKSLLEKRQDIAMARRAYFLERYRLKKTSHPDKEKQLEKLGSLSPSPSFAEMKALTILESSDAKSSPDTKDTEEELPNSEFYKCLSHNQDTLWGRRHTIGAGVSGTSIYFLMRSRMKVFLPCLFLGVSGVLADAIVNYYHCLDTTREFSKPT